MKQQRLSVKLESNKNTVLTDSSRIDLGEYINRPYKQDDSLPIPAPHTIKPLKKDDKSWFTDKKVKE